MKTLEPSLKEHVQRRKRQAHLSEPLNYYVCSLLLHPPILDEETEEDSERERHTIKVTPQVPRTAKMQPGFLALRLLEKRG